MRVRQAKPIRGSGVHVLMRAAIDVPIRAAAGDFVSVLQTDTGGEAMCSSTADTGQLIAHRFGEGAQFVPMLAAMVHAGQAVWLDAGSAAKAAAAAAYRPMQPREA